MGEYYEAELKELAARYPALVERMEGRRHLASLFFHKTETVTRFVSALVQGGIDISVQSYKANCPPSCMTKLPLITHAEGRGISHRQDGRRVEGTVMAARKRVRFGIIGLGLMGREFGSAIGRWCHLLSEGPVPELVGICDTNEKSHAVVHGQLPHHQGGDDSSYEDLLGSRDIDAIYCAVPTTCTRRCIAM